MLAKNINMFQLFENNDKQDSKNDNIHKSKAQEMS